jgi:hypothetical protein
MSVYTIEWDKPAIDALVAIAAAGAGIVRVSFCGMSHALRPVTIDSVKRAVENAIHASQCGCVYIGTLTWTIEENVIVVEPVCL